MNTIFMPSTVITDFGYDAAAKKLKLRFVSGMVYEYLHVPEKNFSGMKKVVFKGKYLNRFIKGCYKFKKVT